MYRFRRIIVGMTLGDQDEAKLRYTAMIGRLAQAETVYFIHVIGSPGEKSETVLFIPEGMKPEFSNILVPVDFSDISHDAVDVAVLLGAAANLDTIRCINIYNVPIGYHKSGKSYEQFAGIMRGHAENNFAKFIEKIDCRNVAITPVYKLERSVCKTIDEYVREHYIDLLIIGGRGRRAGAAFVLGSVTEKLISSTSMPLLAVKRKGEGLSVFEALLRL